MRDSSGIVRVFGIDSDSKLWDILFGSSWRYSNYNNPLDTGLRIKALCTNSDLRKSIYKYVSKNDNYSLDKLQEKIISKYPDYNVR